MVIEISVNVSFIGLKIMFHICIGTSDHVNGISVKVVGRAGHQMQISDIKLSIPHSFPQAMRLFHVLKKMLGGISCIMPYLLKRLSKETLFFI